MVKAGTPTPSPVVNPRRWNMLPQPPAPASPTAALSPSFSSAPFRAAETHSSPDEHPCVALFEWWLVRVEGDEQKIAVAGFTQTNQTIRIFTSAPIVKRYDACTLETEDGIVVLIHGSLSISRMRENGFSPEVCEKFLIGFPFWWESCNVFSPKTNNSHIGSQPSSSNTNNSRVDSTQCYLEKFQLGKFLDSVGSSFIGNLLNKAKSFSGDNADADAFQKCSYLSNETPLFEEYNCDSNISTKEKAAASDDGNKGSAVCKEVDNVEIYFTVGSTSKESGFVDNDLNVSLALTEECTSETYKEAGNQNDIMHPDASEQEAGSHLFNSNLIYNRFTDHMPSDLENVNANARSSVDLGSSYFLATVPPERANCSTEIGGDLENTPPISCHRTPVASSKNQGCCKRTQDITLNEKVQEFVLLDGDERHSESAEKTSSIRDAIKICYPSSQHPDSVELSRNDIKCLEPESFLSSSIMNFYIRYLQGPMSSVSRLRGKYHIFNTYFFTKLEALTSKVDRVAYLNLRRWWEGVHIFQKAYILLPVHADTHWSLVIICMPAKEDQSGPIILHLDSLKFHSRRLIFSVVDRFLKEEWNYLNESGSSAEFPIQEMVWKNLPHKIEKKPIEVPQQKNGYDCGLFVLYYMQRFIEEAPERLYKEDLSMFGKEWFQPEEASALRKKMQAWVLQLFQEAKPKSNTAGPNDS